MHVYMAQEWPEVRWLSSYNVRACGWQITLIDGSCRAKGVSRTPQRALWKALEDLQALRDVVAKEN